ncbi:MAG TPA: T9SS type A sorting domain-containing protein [bacterium]|nr:T9SS type A sorting domain-containing protein [bacterium]HPN42848.1 T9SS type A sorting domain-containing protein [bacterium]
MKWKNLLWLAFLLLTTGAFPQTKTLDRQYVPIILSNSVPPIYNININEWTAFRYDRSSKTWHGVPFQVDEVRVTGHYQRDVTQIYPEIDQNDEIVFMPEDLGDRAPQSAWVDVTGSDKVDRIEVQITDPLDTGKTGWLYLFKNVNNPPIIPGYFTYGKPATTTSADTLITNSYRLVHNGVGMPEKLSFSPAFSGDFIDRLKFRFSGKPALGSAYNITENGLYAQTSPLSTFPGSVRYFRDVRDRIKIPITLVGDKDFNPNLQYFPYSVSGQVSLDITGGYISLAGVKLIRLSVDLAPDAAGMNFFSEKNSAGQPINGSPDTPDKTITDPNTLNWFMATGPQGTVVMNLKLPAVENATTQLYYRDNSAGGSADGTDDTGDNQSWGDMGIYISTTGDYISTTKLEVVFTMYFINQNFTANAAEMGDKIRDWQENPCTVSAVLQSYDATRINKKTYKPTTFQMSQPYPNPFHHQSGSLAFSFTSAKQRDDYTLTIYNILGQEIRRYANIYALKDSKRIVFWDGRNSGGVLVMPGTYFYKLQNSRDSLTGKFIIIP